jgi:hypothetical protein
MPAAVVAAISAIGTAVGGTAGAFLIMNATALASGVLLLGGMALSNYQRTQAKKKATESFNAAQVDRLANVVTTVGPRELVLGRVRKGGAIYFRGTAGAYRETFLAHLSLAGHEIDAVETVYLHDKPVRLDASGNVLDAPYAQTRRQSFIATIPAGSTTTVLPHTPVPGTTNVIVQNPSGGEEQVTDVKFTLSGRTVTLSSTHLFSASITYQANVVSYYAKVWWELGDENATVDARTKALFPSLWTVNHRARGVAKLFAEFTYNETAFPSGIPTLSAVIRGAKCYDPRTATTAWTENPALHVRHVYTHAKFGKATPSAAEEERFIAAANACDTPHTYTLSNGTSVATQLYRSALVVPFGTQPKSAIDDLCQAMAGAWAFTGGELHVKAGVFTAPVLQLTESDLAVIQRDGERERQEAITISPHRERVQKFNVINLQIWDSEQAYKQVPLAPFKAAALIARDGQELAQPMQLPAVPFAPQAKHIAGIAMRDARDPLTFEAYWKLKAYPVQIFDTVGVTNPRYGWDAKPCMVLRRTWDRENARVHLVLKETAPEIFTPDAAFEPEGYAENTALPSPFDIEPPVLLPQNVSSGTSELVARPDGTFQTRVRVAWALVNSAAVQSDGRIELQWQEVGASTWNTTLVPGDQTEVHLTGPVDGTAIVIRARSRTELAVSDWSLQLVHIVVGKSAPPAPPSAVAATRDLIIFTPSPDIDVKGYRILYNEGTNTERSVARALHSGLVAGSPWSLPVRLYGVNTIIVVAVDAVGNESAPVTTTQNLGTPDLANVADEVDFVAAGYPGSISGGSIVDGVLVADSDPAVDFWGNGRGTGFWYLDGADDMFGGTQYQQLTYSYVYAAPYDGAAILMDLALLGARETVEVRVDGSTVGDFWDAARPDFWANDVASVWGTSGEFGAWNGSIVPCDQVGYEFRITIPPGSKQGTISEVAVRSELPQLDQVFGRVEVSAGGTVISPADGIPFRRFRRIEDVQITPIGNASTGGRVKSYPIDPEVGPEIEMLDSASLPVDSPAYVRLSGF